MDIHMCKAADRWPETDARGIFLCYVCDICYEKKIAKYRPEVLTDPNYWVDEPIDEEAYYSSEIFPSKRIKSPSEELMEDVEPIWPTTQHDESDDIEDAKKVAGNE